MKFELGPEGMYIKSGRSSVTDITVNGETVTDGKTTSRILLELDEATGADGNGE